MTEEQRHQFTITRLGHQGDGVTEDGHFAPRTLPGEIVTGCAEGSRLSDIKLVTPSPERISAPCRHYKSCGGCQLQHASDAFIANWKQSIVEAALAARGISTEFRPIITSPAASRRRAALSAKRTKKGALAGFHARASDTILQIPDCRLLDPRLLPALEIAEQMARLGASRRGELSVTVTLSQNGLDIATTGGSDPDGPLLLKLAQLAEAADLARLTWSDETLALRRPPIQVFGKAEVTPPPGAFLQATLQGEAALQAAVSEIVSGAFAIIDLFSGCGTFSLPLAETSRVHAVEGEADMIRALEKGWRNASGLKRVTAETRDLFRNPLVSDELADFDACVIDPPRAGAEAQVACLAESGIPIIAFVSCNPTTFARDAAHLVQAGYSLDWVQVVDQFRWSSHVELVGKLTLTSP